jgi:hypothetical protein
MLMLNYMVKMDPFYNAIILKIVCMFRGEYIKVYL